VIRYDTIGEFNVDWKAEYGDVKASHFLDAVKPTHHADFRVAVASLADTRNRLTSVIFSERTVKKVDDGNRKVVGRTKKPSNFVTG